MSDVFPRTGVHRNGKTCYRVALTLILINFLRWST